MTTPPRRNEMIYDLETDSFDPAALEERPAQDVDGLWDALDANGDGHLLGFATREECVAWLQGYHTGAKENM